MRWLIVAFASGAAAGITSYTVRALLRRDRPEKPDPEPQDKPVPPYGTHQ